eukprot:g69115.t1
MWFEHLPDQACNTAAQLRRGIPTFSPHANSTLSPATARVSQNSSPQHRLHPPDLLQPPEADSDGDHDHEGLDDEKQRIVQLAHQVRLAQPRTCHFGFVLYYADQSRPASSQRETSSSPQGSTHANNEILPALSLMLQD